MTSSSLYLTAVIDSELWLPVESLIALGLGRLWKMPVSGCSICDSQLHAGLLQEDNKGRLIHLLSGWGSPCHTHTHTHRDGTLAQECSLTHPFTRGSSLTDRPLTKTLLTVFAIFFIPHNKFVQLLAKGFPVALVQRYEQYLMVGILSRQPYFYFFTIFHVCCWEHAACLLMVVNQ